MWFAFCNWWSGFNNTWLSREVDTVHENNVVWVTVSVSDAFVVSFSVSMCGGFGFI